MASINHAILGGNLTQDPDLKTIVTRQGEEILAAEARVAISRKGSEKKDYFTVHCYRQAAENLAEYRGKGDAVIVTAEARHQRWEAEDGSPRSRHVFPVRSIQYVDSAGRGVNSGVLAGNITRDPEMRYAKVGDDMVPVTTFGLAVNRVRSDDPDAVDFFDVVCWRGLAEVVANNKLKGDGVLVEGRFQLDQWKNDADESRQKVVFVADEVQFTTLPPEEGEVVANTEDLGEEEEFDEIDDLADEAPVAETSGTASRNGGRGRQAKSASRNGSRHSSRGGTKRAATRKAAARR